MQDIVAFSLIMSIVFRILGLDTSIDFYFREKNNIFKIFGSGWLLWGFSGVLPLIANNVSNQFLSDFLIINSVLLTSISILIFCWGIFSYYFLISWKYVIAFSIITFLTVQFLFLNTTFEFTLFFTSLISLIIWNSLLILPLKKRALFTERVQKQVRYNIYIVIIIGLLYIPISIIINIKGENYGLYDSNNVFLIMLFYSYSLFIVVFFNMLVMHLEYLLSLAQKDNLKDKFSHDLGNTLQSIYASINLLEFTSLNQKDKIEVNETLNIKLNEAKKLLRQIRKL